jgi:hypothetical protein
MPIPQPSLDDTTYAQLLDLALRRIPVHAPEWTNHNESDPGITIVQLLAYFAEMLLFQTSQITDRDREAFTRLLGGKHIAGAGQEDWFKRLLDGKQVAGADQEDWFKRLLDGKQVAGADPKKELSEAIVRRRIEQRAVTASDFEHHALAAHPGVARAKCLARRNLEEPSQAARRADRPGHVSVVILPKENTEVDALLRHVFASLDWRRLLTVRVHVVPVAFVKIRVRFRVILSRGVPEAKGRLKVTKEIKSFLDPLNGGHERKGWPFGRALFVSELYRILARLPEVDYVTPQHSSGTMVRLDEIESFDGDSNRADHNREGELTALRLFEEELPLLTDTNVETATQ